MTIDQHYYDMGCEAFRQERYMEACQEMLDAIPDLTHNQRESFFLGWNDTYRELKGPTTEDIYFPTLPSQIREREASIKRLRERCKTPKEG